MKLSDVQRKQLQDHTVEELERRLREMGVLKPEQKVGPVLKTLVAVTVDMTLGVVDAKLS